jgi:hypothetical protein
VLWFHDGVTYIQKDVHGVGQYLTEA